MKEIEEYRVALQEELTAILSWWKINMPDKEQDGFWGEVGNDNLPLPAAAKGLVLTSRVLWTFSAAWLVRKDPTDLAIAHRAFDYLCRYFLDPRYGGFYWSLNADGTMLEGKKQIYGQAFAIYGLAEYYKASGNPEALTLAKATFGDIEKYSYDPVNLGYVEALDIDWQPTSNLRLSDKDLNAKKSMNTHLHVVEAYANLYTIWKSEELAKAITQLLLVFKRFIITSDGHLSLFFTENWQPLSAIVSYGHDIEAAWLLLECAETINDKAEIAFFKKMAVQLSDAVMPGIAGDGGMCYEYDPTKQQLIEEKHWWPQAEAMVGFFNAYQLSGDRKYLDQSVKSWLFVNAHLKDLRNGEWYWGLNTDYSLMPANKAGFWKCPYHNGRACMEILKRIESQQ